MNEKEHEENCAADADFARVAFKLLYAEGVFSQAFAEAEFEMASGRGSWMQVAEIWEAQRRGLKNSVAVRAAIYSGVNLKMSAKNDWLEKRVAGLELANKELRAELAKARQ
jgi:hypothetical protein